MASDYLKRNGYEIVARNMRVARFEIDIIAKFNQKIVFVEVRTRTSLILGRAVEAFGSNKIKAFRQAIMAFVNERQLDENYVRADFVAVDWDQKTKTAKIKHYKDCI